MATRKDRRIQATEDIRRIGGELGLDSNQVAAVFTKIGKVNVFSNADLLRLEGERDALSNINSSAGNNQDIRNKLLGERFTDPSFNAFRQGAASDKVRVESGGRRARGFTGALRGGRQFLARERQDDQNDRPFLGG